MTHQAKQDLRERMKTLLRKQEKEVLLEKSTLIAQKLLDLKVYVRAQLILFFASFDGEVNTFPMMEQAFKDGKQVALPTINRESHTFTAHTFSSLEDLEPGPYGIQQIKKSVSKEVSPQEIDLVIVPALAYDRNRNRLGRGGGFYDRYLGVLPKDTPTVGLIYDFQLLDTLPTDTHDQPVTHVVTNS